MHDHDVHKSPLRIARVGGLLYLIIIAGGLFGEAFIRNKVIIPSDAEATAAHLKTPESLWRFGLAGEFFMLTCTVVLALILYVLLRPVNGDLALLAVFFNLISVAVEAGNELQLLAALSPLGNAAYLAAFTPEQLQAMTSLSLKAYGYGFGASLVFFGTECLVLGYLIFRSGYMPRLIGVLMSVAGLCYLTNSFVLYASPALSNMLFPAILIPSFFGELALCLWLLSKGVNMERWNARIGAGHVSPAEA